MQKVALELRNVSKTFLSSIAVDNVSLKVAEGEFVTFLGPSGSGKTTTLMMVAGLQQPTGGEIFLREQPIAALAPYRRNIGMVFQHYALFPHMTVASNIAFPLEMRGFKHGEIGDRVSNALQLVGLPKMSDRYPQHLSGGQQQRVALARAIVYEPSILLMDEPLGALDKKLREQMQLEIMELHRKLKMSVLYVTHDQEEALIMSDRIAVFNSGRIDQIGSPRDLYEYPENSFVANFVGETNFLPGRVVDVGDGIATVETRIGSFRGRKRAASLQIGDQAVLAVRPERITAYRGADDGPINLISGRVREIIYLGQSDKYIVELADGSRLQMLRSYSDGNGAAYQKGAEIRLGWSPQQCNIL